MDLGRTSRHKLDKKDLYIPYFVFIFFLICCVRFGLYKDYLRLLDMVHSRWKLFSHDDIESHPLKHVPKG